MVSLRPIILALLLAVAAPAAAIPSSAPTTQSSAATLTADTQVYAPENTSAMLTLGEDADETRAFARPTLDVGTALAVQKDAMDSELSIRSLDAQFEGAETRGDRRDLLLKYATYIDTRRSELAAREKTARESFRNGSISGEVYVQKLVLIQARAQNLQQEIDRVRDYESEVSEFSLIGLLGPFEKQLLSYRGPVVDRATGSSFGTASPIRVYVSAAENGIVLSMIEDGSYVREAFREDLRNLDDEGQLTQEQAKRIVERTYPWATNNSFGSSWRGFNPEGYHYRETEYEHGLIISYIDVSGEAVFKEHQTKYLTPSAASRNDRELTMPRGPGVTANESGLLLTVNRSYPGGPMYVALQDNETGEFVEGTVAIDGETVGQTSADGGLWTLSPAGSFNVSAASGLNVVSVQTRATRPLKTYNTTQN